MVQQFNQEVDINGYPLVLNSAASNLTNSQINASIQVEAGGSGYTSAPTVAISAPPGNGTQATASLGPGPITGIVIQNGGSGYTSNATIAFSPSGAQATLVLGTNGQIIAVIIGKESQTN